MANTHQSLGQYVQQKPADELLRVEGHHLVLTIAVVAPVKAYFVFFHVDQPVVGDGHAMGVAPQVSKDLLGAAEGALGVGHPVFAIQAVFEFGKGARIGKVGGAAFQR